MRFWFDTEFIEDGVTIDLISIGVVAEDGRTYYAESVEADLSKACEWVKENVIVHLKGNAVQKSRAQIAKDLLQFFGDDPQIFGYFPSYDWVVLAQLYGRMIDLPESWPRFPRDVKQLWIIKGRPPMPGHTGKEHNALDDAQWTRKAWEFLVKLAPVQDDEWLSKEYS